MNFKLICILSLIMLINGCKKAPKYKGGWPTNTKSDYIENPGYNDACPGPIGCECNANSDCLNENCISHPRGNYCAPKKGDIMPRFIAKDQFGENVDLYDFSKQGKMILIELSTAWCNPCNDLASWITNNNQKIKTNPWWNQRYSPIRDMINQGDVLMINYLFEGEERKITATQNDVKSWYNKYPDANIPILLDENRDVHSWVKPTGLPCIFLLDENMRLINFTNRGLTDAFLYLTKP